MSSTAMTIEGKSVLVTGANRGLGRALVEEALRRGAARVYAGARKPFTHPDARVTPLTLDVTDPAQIQAAVEQVESLDILVNNAGISLPDDLSDRAAVDRHLAVNLFGTWGVTEAFLSSLTRSGAAIVNVVSIGAFAAVPVLPAYSISKAAAFSLTQSLRALLAGRGVRVHAVMPGPIDTDMVRDLPIPKTPPQSVAQAVLDGMENGEEEIFPDPLSEMMAESWRTGAAKALERQNAALVQPQPLAA
jgi:NAD(P)-dependent dehydrogenase (short-subunit alcohol dehydrogenase family)